MAFSNVIYLLKCEIIFAFFLISVVLFIRAGGVLFLRFFTGVREGFLVA